VGKFLRRRWLAVGLFSLTAAAITAAAVFAGFEARAAHAEATKSDQVNRFLTEMLATPDDQRDADQRDVGKYTVEQMLEAADQRLQNAQDTDARDTRDGKLQKASIGGPLTLAILHKSLAASYLAQLRYDKVQTHLDRAIPVFRAAGDFRSLAETLTVQALSETDQGHYQEADRLYQEALANYRIVGKAAPAVDVFAAKRQHAQLLSLLMHARPQEARALFDDLLAMGASDPSIPRVDVAVVMANRGLMLLDTGKLPEAEAAILDALAMGRKEVPEGTWEFDPLFTLTIIYTQTHQYQAGKQAAQRMIDVNLHAAGPESPLVAQARNIWATFAVETGESAAAADAMRESMRVIEKSIQPPSLNLWHAARNASNVMRIAGQYADAERYARESLAVVQAAHLAENDQRVANSWEALGRALHEEKKHGEAASALENAERIYRHAGGAWTSKADDLHSLIIGWKRSARPPAGG
jgi:tetratricopeptide (TPR) repeat protein